MSKIVEPPVPKNLLSTLSWFSRTIVRPLNKEGKIDQLTEREASYYIRNTPTLSPLRCMEIYNQQYWWRLLATLHDIFRGVVRLLGYEKFNNEIAIPYLTSYPPHHFSLNTLGDQLPLWLHLHRKDSFLLEFAKVDLAYNCAFLAKNVKSLDANDLEDPHLTLTHPPSLFLFSSDFPLFTFRNQLLYLSIEEAVKEKRPEKNSTPYFFVLYRTPDYHMLSEEISKEEYDNLSLFHHSLSVDEACEQCTANELQLLEFFQKWVSKRWLIKAPIKK